MKHTCPTPRRQESMNASSGLPSTRAAHPGIVPLMESEPGDVPESVGS